MSSNHHLGLNTGASGEIEHTSFLSEHIGALFLNDEYSDIVLKVNENRFHGHKVILAARSQYFRALLFGGMRESKQAEIELKGASTEAFKYLLKYIYTGHILLSALKEDVILDMLGLAHQYVFVDLEAAISDFLRQALQLRNVCAVYDAARLYQLRYLSRVCAAFMDITATEILAHESFLQLSPGGLKELLDRDSFYAPEAQIFGSVAAWAAANCVKPGNPSLAVVLASVRLPLMTLAEMLTIVRPTGLVDADALLDAIAVRIACRDGSLQHRGVLKMEENVADCRHGSQVVQGEMRSALLDGDSLNYDMERGYTRHAINEAGDHGILIKLGTQSIVNCAKMLLWDRDLRSYSYYIEVSMNQEDWTRVVDHTKYYCRSWQLLYFEPRVIRYVRIVGTNNTVNKVFHVVSFELMYTATKVTLEKGLVVPRHNVACNTGSASVIEGVSRSRNALLDGNTKSYDWDSGYTCHQLGSGAILVQLGQPYMLDSMRLLLWDCDERSYSYYVEVSVNSADWDLVWDKTRESCQSWQLIKFSPRPVVFVRIIGTHNTANEVFHVVHFECPAQGDSSEPTPACSSPNGRQPDSRPPLSLLPPPLPSVRIPSPALLQPPPLTATIQPSPPPSPPVTDAEVAEQVVELEEDTA